MANDNDGGMPSLEDVMKGGLDTIPGSKNALEDDDLMFDDRPFDPFAKDDTLENDPNRKETKKDEVVFEVLEDDDGADGDDEEFKDTRKKGDPKKMSRLQREIKLKNDARDTLAKLNAQVNRVAAETTEARRNEMHTRRALAEMAKSTAISNIKGYEADLERAKEAGETGQIGAISRAQAEAESIIIKADALIDRYAPEKVNAYVYDPQIPENLRDVNGGGTARGKDWIDANAAWFNNPDKFGAEIAFARATDAALAKEGKFDLNSEAYYEELTKRVALNMRNIEVYTPDGRLARIGERQRGGSKVADTTGSSSQRGGTQSRTPPTRGGKETISAEEQRLFRNMGIDLSKKEHVEELKQNRIR